MEKPKAPNDGQKCPLWKKHCYLVCHTCRMWQHVLGSNPQTNEHVDIWECSLALGPLLILENTKAQRETGAAVESFRNVMAKGLAKSYASKQLSKVENAVRGDVGMLEDGAN